MKSDLNVSREKLKQELDAAAECAVRDARSPVAIAIANILGDANTPNKLNAQTRVQTILKEWSSEWRFPKNEGAHVLSVDMSIPLVLRPGDLESMKEVDESDSDSDGVDGEDAEDNQGGK